MSRLEELIAELCPEGVKSARLIDICNVLYGFPFDSKKFTDDDCFIPLIRIRDVKPGKTSTYYRGTIIPDYIVIKGDILVGMDGEFNIGKWNDKDALLNQRVCKITSKDERVVLNSYIFHFLGPKLKKIEKSIIGSTVKHLSAKVINSIHIPLPPLPIQQEIVRILDKFTELKEELTAEITAEITARRKQFEYYRNLLLTFGDEVEWKTLGNISINTYSGGTPQANNPEYYGGDIPWLRTQEVRFMDIYDTEMRITQAALENSAAKWIPENCVIIAISGATAGRCAINKIPLTTNQHCCCLEIDPKQANYRYVFYWVSSQYEQLKSLGQGARSDLNSGIIKRYPIPIPPIEEQERIVAILDRFDVLYNDLTSSLTAEIETLQKQYEYYRDKLLSFKEVSA